MGFPSSDDFSNVFGVGEEDRQKWEKQHESLQKRSARSGLRQSLDSAGRRVVGVGERQVNAQLNALYREETARRQDRARYEETVTTSRTTSHYLDEEDPVAQAEDGLER